MKPQQVAAVLGWAAGAGWSASEEITVDRVWAGHPVQFALLTAPPHQYVGYYDADRWMTIAQRRLGATNWTRLRLDSQLGWDSHNSIAMAVDRTGRLHVAGNMHCVPLVYYRSREPADVTTLQRQPGMVGERESSVTYPVFFRDAAGRLLFRYREGRSGRGDDLLNVWDDTTQRWRHWLDTPLFSGEGKMNAYATVPTQGPDGRFHIVWVWRNSPDCASSHSPGYARSRDLCAWEDAFGRPLPLPITPAAGGTVDPVAPGGGVINGNVRLGFDSAARPIVTYHKYDVKGDLQIFVARPESNHWRIVQVSDWAGYRWSFGGAGSIAFEVRVHPIRWIAPGRLLLRWHRRDESGVWLLDETTLRLLPAQAPPDIAGAREAAECRLFSERPDLELRTAPDSGESPSGTVYRLVWETLGPNRDRPRNPPWPAPSRLRVVRMK
ncbi:MAG: BNR repeat-containing protein [Kiritimatiellae bacterium]|nr:BNR repeat-containing protein [Kiritimatiellia bacterium]